MAEEDAIDFSLENYAASGTEGILRTVGFGPVSNMFAVLIEIDPDDESIRVTIGNGPDHEQVPWVISEVLRVIADEIEDVGSAPEFEEYLK